MTLTCWGGRFTINAVGALSWLGPLLLALQLNVRRHSQDLQAVVRRVPDLACPAVYSLVRSTLNNICYRSSSPFNERSEPLVAACNGTLRFCARADSWVWQAGAPTPLPGAGEYSWAKDLALC